jgi:hypothetical protein
VWRVRFFRERRGSKPGTTLPHGFQRGEMSWFLNVPGGHGGTRTPDPLLVSPIAAIL